ncbi:MULTISPECIES: DUF2065 domain-containing protein [Chelatococcus]|uniref:DUF2065 domain-containing protein n=1 Tax=Chelatococcus caeni TaxID=1348468 RepID=A0A840C670_9HYPH|nr:MULTISPECIES: DUF2065 domain-containing protein [Chelatococcus]ALA16347.1 hypothetical protein AL346_01665 [Chelatococcus sp. CO-6]MBB4017897.1 hypothetical protein [Chelatococcus caeni]
MMDFLAALGLVLAIEGLIFAAFPSAAKRALAEASEAPIERMRIVGVVSAVLGVIIIWYVRWGGA